MSAIEKIRESGSAALSESEPSADLAGAGERERELHSLLSAKNGFLCFESALRVFPSGGGEGSLEAWNAKGLWRDWYDDMANGILFFAEDAFGNQFGITESSIVLFDAETGDVEVIAHSLEAWAEKVLADYESMTGYPLAHAWQKENGGLAVKDRLIPKTPFVSGGAFAVENLYAHEAVQAMRFRGDLARQIRDVPDGAAIEFKVVP